MESETEGNDVTGVYETTNQMMTKTESEDTFTNHDLTVVTENESTVEGDVMLSGNTVKGESKEESTDVKTTTKSTEERMILTELTTTVTESETLTSKDNTANAFSGEYTREEESMTEIKSQDRDSTNGTLTVTASLSSTTPHSGECYRIDFVWLPSGAEQPSFFADFTERKLGHRRGRRVTPGKYLAGNAGRDHLESDARWNCRCRNRFGKALSKTRRMRSPGNTPSWRP